MMPPKWLLLLQETPPPSTHTQSLSLLHPHSLHPPASSPGLRCDTGRGGAQGNGNTHTDADGLR